VSIRTACVRDAASAADGHRLLITRYWPRGLTKAAVAAEWQPALAPSRELIQAFKRGQIDWRTFAARFRQEMRSPAAQAALDELRVRSRELTVTLLCECRAPDGDESAIQCHRRLVRELTRKANR
jgi:uncharacterized protein YeaO (DUF488 family)